jgi:hypothetical protein
MENQPVDDNLVPLSAATVNANPPAAGAPPELEADRYYLPDMIRLALDRLESASIAASRAVRAAEMAKVAADEVNDQAAACELGAIVDAIADIPDSLADAHQGLESAYEERAPEDDRPVGDAGDIGDNDDDDDNVAGYLAVSPSTPDSVIDGFIAAVGADRVLGALDRMTQPQIA